MRPTRNVRMASARLLAIVPAVLALSGCAPAGPPAATVEFAGVDPERANYVVASGTVTGLSEDGGKCVFTFWADTGVATRLTGEGRAADGRTDCGPVEEPLGFMIGVNYEVELKYVSNSGEIVQSVRVAMVLPRVTESAG